MSKRSASDAITRVRTVPRLARRARDSHKGTFGRVLIMGGSVGMSGAPALAGLAALRAGAGLVVLAVPRSIQSIVATLCPCATSIGLPETPEGQIDPTAARDELRARGLCGEGATAKPDALVVGMGLGRGDRAYARACWELIDDFRVAAGVPSVIDADALNLATRGGGSGAEVWDARPHPRTIITPHPGELARLLGISTFDVQRKREETAVEAGRILARDPKSEPRPVAILKGAGTLVTDGKRLYTNRTGNPGMATGGSGDVLGGVIGALVAQGVDPFEAAIIGVHVHGLAGDLGARQLGELSLTALDLLAYLPHAFRRITARAPRSR